MVAIVAALAVLGALTGLWWLVAPVAVTGWIAERVVDRWRVRRRRAGRRQMVLEVCDALAAELRAGMASEVAIMRACTAWPELEQVAASARLGGDVPAAWRVVARKPGAEGLRAVAASWEVSSRSGAALAGVLDRVGSGLRDDEDALAEVEAALGPPRATAKMLAVLPLMGIGLGMSIGAEPLGFLLQTPIGLGCLAAGVLLALTGLWWVERLAAAVEA